MKFARHCCQLLLLAMLSPTVALALGLGDIHLKSSLDAPLDADIDLVDADAEDLSTLKATLASRDTFKHLGADYPSFLGTVTLTPERTADGRAFIHVHSAGVAAEPFATLLVEVDWARGHLVREYTVLLDPPLYNSQAPSNAAVSAPVAGATAQGGAVEHAPDASASAAPDTSASAAAPAAAASGAPPANNATTASSPPAPSAASPSPDSNAAAPAPETQPAPQVASNASPASANAAASAPTSEPAPSSAASTPQSEAPPQAKSEPSAEPKSGPAAAPTHADTYTVRAGDTLSSIAEQTYGASDRKTRDRALVAIYRANPKAFHENMNVLYTGRVLKLPGDSELEAIGPGEATQEVRQQYASWRDEHGGERVASGADTGRGQLRLVAPQEAAEQPGVPPAQPSTQGPATNAGSSAATAALQQRVQQLESQLAESQRLLQMRSAELAALQARVQQEAANAHPPATSVTPPTPAAANPTQPTPAPVSAPPPAPVTPPVAQTPTPAVPAPAPPRPQATPPAAPLHPITPHPVGAKRAHPVAPPPSTSLVDVVLEHWYVPAIVILLLIGALAVRWFRARQEEAFDRSLGELTPAVEDEAPQRSDTMPVRTMTGVRQEPSYHVEESGTHVRPNFAQELEGGSSRSAEPVAAAPPPPPPPAPPAEAPVALDQGDPLAEADFHMAYGLYDQAAELVQIAITRDPKRRDLKMKLLEVFFVWGNRERFLQTAHQLAESRDQAPAGEWEKILIMGRQIAPEDPLFSDSRGLAGAGKVVDLNLEGGQNRVDFDLLGEPSLGTAVTQESVELDLGAALAEPSATEATGEAPQIGGHEDIVLDASEHADATGTTREMPEAASASAITALRPAPAGAGSTETMRIVNHGEPESPTVEQPQLRSGDQALRHKLDAHPGEQTAELAIDDLGLDLSALDGHEGHDGHAEEPAAAVDPNAPTLLADLDEDTRRMFEGAEAQATQRHPAAQPAEAHATDVTQKAAVAGGARPQATGTWMFTDTDFGAMAPVAKASPSPTAVITQISAPAETASTQAALSALHSGELDLDLGNLESIKEPPSNGLDLDVGAPGARHETPHTDTQKLKNDALVSDDMALPDLEPVTLSEVGTKLDLARAYMDMGDPEGARSILAEVMSEGSMSQKQEARRLMDALPG